MDEPSRRNRCVTRTKLSRNANFQLQEVLRAMYWTFQCSRNEAWNVTATLCFASQVALVCVVFLCFACQGCAGLRILIVFCTSGLRWSAFSYCASHLRVARIHVVFCTSGLRWSAYSYCVLQLRVALVGVIFLCFALQSCAGQRILFVFCISGLRWSAYSYCVLHLRVALVCVFLLCFTFRVALVCVIFLCFAAQGCAGLHTLIVLCTSGLRGSAYSLLRFASKGCGNFFCVWQFWVALVCLVLM